VTRQRRPDALRLVTDDDRDVGDPSRAQQVDMPVQQAASVELEQAFRAAIAVEPVSDPRGEDEGGRRCAIQDESFRCQAA
jgi:hypothetical protein